MKTNPPAVLPATQPDVWEILDHHLQQLALTDDIGRQLRLTLEAVRGALSATAVLLYSGLTGEVQEVAGLELAASASVARQLVAQAGDSSQLLVPRGPAGSSAALVRLSRSRAAWVIALRDPPALPLKRTDLEFMALARRMLHQQQQQQSSQERLKEVVFNLIQCLTAALDARDPYTRGHSERVARIAVRLGQQLRLPETTCSELYLGGLLHDIGKIGVPDAVLCKPGKLTAEEIQLIQQHPVIGDAIVSHVGSISHLRPMVRSHHEQYDGSGYPDHLAGETIPLLARIVAVADACDAMMADRPYRPALPRDRIEAIFRGGASSQWDPHIVEAFLGCRQELFSIAERGLGDSVFRAVGDALRPRTPALYDSPAEGLPSLLSFPPLGS